jgi:hypothetical protein
LQRAEHPLKQTLEAPAKHPHTHLRALTMLLPSTRTSTLKHLLNAQKVVQHPCSTPPGPDSVCNACLQPHHLNITCFPQHNVRLAGCPPCSPSPLQPHSF